MNTAGRLRPVAQGQVLPDRRLGPLKDSAPLVDDKTDHEQLKHNLDEDGYVYISNFFSREDTLAARSAIFGRLAEVGEIVAPVAEGIYSGTSRRREMIADLGAFWRSVSESWTLRRLSHGAQLHALTAILFGEASRVQDYVFLRPVNPGKFTHIHCDAPFFTRMTERVLTVWVALNDVPFELGPLFVVEQSHRFADIVDRHRNFDVVNDEGRKVAFSESPGEFAEARNARLLSGNITAGDVIVFGMYTLHGTFDNVSADNRCRLTCDVRYQPLSAAVDERYFNADPTGTTGAGYGELVGAKPLNEPWHVR